MARFALELTVALPGLEPIRVALNRVQVKVTDWRDYWKVFALRFREMAADNFDTEGAATGGGSSWSYAARFGNASGPWAALSPRYAAWKSAHSNKGILELTGRLRRGATGVSGESVYRATPKSLVIGTSVPYAMYHQVGTRRMPQRPIFRADERFMKQAGRDLQKYVREVYAREKAAAGGKS